MIAAEGKVQYLVNPDGFDPKAKPLPPYDDGVIAFLNRVSQELLADPQAKRYPDIVSFAFWCRRANLIRLKADFGDQHLRLGRGLAFHIAPSNVPINFAFSYAFALLAGNTNVVRVPSREFPQVSIVCDAIGRVLAQEQFLFARCRTSFIRYPHDDEITQAWSAQCDLRILWGGDNTIESLRRFPVPVRCVEVAFADRYSFCALGARALLHSGEPQRAALAEGFYNDTFLMDQNACSSPHLIVWLGTRDEIAQAKALFWDKAHRVVQSKYDLQPISAMDKFTQLCENAIDLNGIRCERQDNLIYRVQLQELPEDLETLRGRYGYFYEFDTESLDDVAARVTPRFQTMTYFGISADQLTAFVRGNALSGIDRIVPVGSALDISVIWDGYDLIGTFSRICRIE